MEEEHAPASENNRSTGASLRQSGQFQKIWSWFKGNILVALGGAIGTLIVAVLSYIAYHAWLFSNSAFNSMIISTVQQELEKDDSKLRKEIKTEILKDLSADQNLPTTIRDQSRKILESALKHKIGPLYAERFTLDSMNPQRIVEVFWRPGHSTKLWVNAIQLGQDDCIILQFPGGQQSVLKKEGASIPIDVEAHLAARQGILPEGTENDDEIELNKGIFAHIHAVTFKLASKQTRESKTYCNGPPKSDSTKLREVEYLTMTEPLVDMGEMDNSK